MSKVAVPQCPNLSRKGTNLEFFMMSMPTAFKDSISATLNLEYSCLGNQNKAERLVEVVLRSW